MTYFTKASLIAGLSDIKVETNIRNKNINGREVTDFKEVTENIFYLSVASLKSSPLLALVFFTLFCFICDLAFRRFLQHRLVWSRTGLEKRALHWVGKTTLMAAYGSTTETFFLLKTRKNRMVLVQAEK